jgi:hypothetical protein
MTTASTASLRGFFSARSRLISSYSLLLVVFLIYILGIQTGTHPLTSNYGWLVLNTFCVHWKQVNPSNAGFVDQTVTQSAPTPLITLPFPLRTAKPSSPEITFPAWSQPCAERSARKVCTAFLNDILLKSLMTNVSWQSMGTGDIFDHVRGWGNPELAEMNDTASIDQAPTTSMSSTARAGTTVFFFYTNCSMIMHFILVRLFHRSKDGCNSGGRTKPTNALAIGLPLLLAWLVSQQSKLKISIS